MPEATQALHLAEDQALCQCGQFFDDCHDPHKVWYPQMSVDYAEMERAATERRYEKLHKERPWHDGKFRNWAQEWSPLTPCHFLDGVRIFVSPTDLDPDATWLESEVPTDGNSQGARSPRAGDELSAEGGGIGGSDPAFEPRDQEPFGAGGPDEAGEPGDW